MSKEGKKAYKISSKIDMHLATTYNQLKCTFICPSSWLCNEETRIGIIPADINIFPPAWVCKIKVKNEKSTSQKSELISSVDKLKVGPDMIEPEFDAIAFLSKIIK
jgi:hypothetical protein